MKRVRRIMALSVAMMLALCLAVGCKASKETTVQTSQETTINGDETVYPLAFTDSYGNTVTIEAEPQRIVSCGPAITELIYALGQEHKLIGRTDYCNYPEACLTVDSVGAIDTPNVEKIVELTPDLVITSSVFSKESYEQLTNLGIKVICFNEERDPEGVYHMITLLGQAINANKEASSAVSEMKTKISDVQSKITAANVPAPTVYYMVSFGEYGDYTCGGDTYIHQIISLAGGKNIADGVEGWSYSVDQLIEKNPDIIIVPGWAYDDFISTEPYNSLSAVKNGKVYTFDTDMLDRQGVRNADAVEELASIFYPDLFAEEETA